MKCGRCGHRVLLGSAQCSKCGASLLDGTMPDEDAPTALRSMVGGWTSQAPNESRAELGPPPESATPPPPPPPDLLERSVRRAMESANVAPPPPPQTTDAPAARHRPPIKVQQGRKATPAGQASKASIGCVGCLGPLLAIVAVGAGIAAFSTSAFDNIGDTFADAFDDGERIAAPAVVLGQDIRFELGSDDTGVHPLAAPVSGPVVVTVSGEGDFDPKVRVVEGGTELGNDDDSGGGHDSLLTVDLVEGRDYEVEVVEFSGDAGEYVLAVSSSVVEGLPVGRASQVDGTVAVGETARHPLAGPGGELTVRVQGRDGFDPVLTIREADGAVLDTNDDADGRDSRLTLAVPADTSIVIEVHGYNQMGGSYTVVVE